MAKNIILAGGTGLIGQHITDLATRTPSIRLTRLVRQGSLASGRTEDFEQLRLNPVEVLKAITPDGVDVAVSCLGTTLKTGGSQTAFFRVDHDYTLALAKGVKALGARHFIIVSAAWAGGPGFYLKTKGQIAQALTAMQFERLDIVRPGFLVGARDEVRPGEEIGQRVSKAISPLLFGPLARFGAISAKTVAGAILALPREATPGRYIHENREIRCLELDG